MTGDSGIEVALTCMSFLFLNASVERSGGRWRTRGGARSRPTAGTWAGCAGDLCWGFSLDVGAGRPTSRPAFGRPSEVCPRWPSRVWRREGMSLWLWPPLPGWRRQGTSSPRLQRRLAWLPWGSAAAVMSGRPSPAGRSRRRRASSAPGR